MDAAEGEPAGGGDKPKPKRTRKIACINCACCAAGNVETKEPKPVSTGLKVLFALANNSCSGISDEKQLLCSACKETVKGKSTQGVLQLLAPLVLQGPSGAGKSGCPARLGSRRPVPLRTHGLSGISLAGRPLLAVADRRPCEIYAAPTYPQRRPLPRTRHSPLPPPTHHPHARTNSHPTIAEDDLDMEGATDAMLGVINFVSQKDAPTADDLATTVLEASTPHGVREVVFTELADGRMEEGLRERRSQAQDSTVGIMDVDEEASESAGAAIDDRKGRGGKGKGKGKERAGGSGSGKAKANGKEKGQRQSKRARR